MRDFATDILKATGYLLPTDIASEGLILPDAPISPGEAARFGPLFSADRGGLVVSLGW